MKPHLNKLSTLLSGAFIGVLLTMGGTVLFANETEKSNQIPMEDVQRFSTAVHEIKTYYVKPVKDKDLFDNAIRGMLSGLDPHSDYLSEEDYKELQQTTRGQFSGLGIEVTMENGLIKVVSPIDDTPAQKAGIKSGDYIVRLGDTPVKGMTLHDAVNKMRGAQGTSINLIVLRKGEEKPMKFNLTRNSINIKSVKGQLLDSKYGYIRVSQFQASTDQEVTTAVEKLKKEANGHLAGLILDLRNNPGGLLDTAIKTSDAFLDSDKNGKEKKIIVYTQGRTPDSRFTAFATRRDILNNAPMIVLINEGSASGAEIVAGALKDNKRAILIGTRTFGKGSVQTVLPLDEHRGIKLTTALYYTPAGTSIQAVGISPDIIINALQMPKEKVGNDDLAMFSEAELTGHLANGNDKANNSDSKASDKTTNSKNVVGNDKPLQNTDFQLHEALNLLKGMALTQK